MKTIGSIFVLVALVTTAFITSAAEKQKTKAKGSGFERIQSLAGDWKVKGGADEHSGGNVSYKVTAGGSAVQETMFGGTEHEMVTMYYMDSDNLELTHYCMLHNHPHMRANAAASDDKDDKDDKIVFKCVEGDDPKLESEDHMHQVTYTFVDNDHVKTEWVLFKDGKEDSKHTFELERKKK